MNIYGVKQAATDRSNMFTRNWEFWYRLA